MKNLVLILVFTCYILNNGQNLYAQTAPSIQWDKTYGGIGLEYLRTILKTPDKGYILGGGSLSGISGNKTQASRGSSDFWVVKVDSLGNKLWDKAYGGSAGESLVSMLGTSDGGYLLGGHSMSGISGDKTQASRGHDDFWIVKIDSLGNKLWDKRFGGNNAEYLYDMIQTTDGGFILGGWSQSNISGDKTQPVVGGALDKDVWVVKIDSAGNKQWDKTFGGNLLDYLLSINQTADGGYLLTNVSASYVSGDKTQPTINSLGSFDCWLVKIDANGNKQWDKTTGTSGQDALACRIQTSDGGFILSGPSKSGIGGIKSEACKGDNDYWIVKIDSLGNKVWDKTLGGNDYDSPGTIHITQDGGFLIAGHSASTLSGDKSEGSYGAWDYWLVKTDSVGNKQWDKTYGGNDLEIFGNFLQTTDGFIVCGSSLSGISGNKSALEKGGQDFWVVKLGPTINGIEQANSSKFNMYPNPSNGLINLELTNSSDIQVSVFNTLGQLVLSKSVGKTANEKNHQLDLSKVSKGIYTVQVLSGNQIITRKVVLQ